MKQSPGDIFSCLDSGVYIYLGEETVLCMQDLNDARRQRMATTTLPGPSMKLLFRAIGDNSHELSVLHTAPPYTCSMAPCAVSVTSAASTPPSSVLSIDAS
jgi:hypothetical protein